jgi:hypothetical protein
MNPKKALPISLIVISCASALTYLIRGSEKQTLGKESAPPIRYDSTLNRQQKDRLQQLESAGQVPLDANIRDWQLAQKTSWWGKPLNPKTFWTNKVVWLDAAAQSLANRHGRTFPPIPYTDTTIPKYNGGNQTKLGSVEDGGLRFDWTPEERAFWTTFTITHPRPPADIESKQLEIYGNILALEQPIAEKGPPITASDVQDVKRVRTQQAIEQGYPTESFSDDALLWTYIYDRRREYEKLLAQGHTAGDPTMLAFIERSHIDPKLLTEPLSADQINTAESWKRTYLSRLQHQKTDQTYIQAYQNAWRLSSTSP